MNSNGSIFHSADDRRINKKKLWNENLKWKTEVLEKYVISHKIRMDCSLGFKLDLRLRYDSHLAKVLKCPKSSTCFNGINTPNHIKPMAVRCSCAPDDGCK
jgi:hypothetical protein